MAQTTAFSSEMLETIGHGVCLYDSRGKITHWSPTLRRLGYPVEGTDQCDVLQVISTLLPDDERLSEISNAMQTCGSKDAGVRVAGLTLRFPTNDSLIFDLHFFGMNGENGGGAIVFTDVTGIQDVRENFERVLDSTPDGLFLIDKSRTIRLFNKACANITGRPAEEILHGCECNNVIDCHTPEGESYAHGLCPAKGVFAGDMPHQREEMLLRNADGEERWVETTYSPVYGTGGEVEYVVGILRDVHERKLLEEKLHQSEKLASLGQLVAGIAHEIKNPLAIMLSSLDVIENPGRSADQRREAGQFLRDEIRRIDERLRAFLAFARPRPLEPRPIVLGGLLRNRVAMMRQLFPRIVMNVEHAASEPIIMGDEEQLHQVLTNLILNAGEAIENDGKIQLRIRTQGDVAILEIEDDGPGISPDLLARIFDPFFTTKAEGTGLGLSVCYRIVLAHRGTISVSRPKAGIGTLFTIRLPMSAQYEGDPVAPTQND